MSEQGILFETTDPGSRSEIIPRYYQTIAHDETFRLFDSGVRGVLTRAWTGSGKCLGKGTLVMLPDGTAVPVEQVEAGDCLMGPDSQTRRVLTTTHGRSPLFLIRPKKGTPFVVNDVHMLTLKATGMGKMDGLYGIHTGDILDIPLDEYLKKPAHFKHIMKGFRVPVEFPDPGITLPVDPYFLGVWLGDGNNMRFCACEVTTEDPEIVDAIHEVANNFGLRVTGKTGHAGNATTYRITNFSRGYPNPLLSNLRMLVPDKKHIPHLYKSNTREVRLAVLAGLMDTDGSMAKRGFDYISKDEALSRDVAFIARSVGLAAYVRPCTKTCYNTGVSGLYWRVSISGDCSIIPTRIPRKKAGKRRQKKDPLVFGFSVEPLGEGDYYGFTLTGDGRFLLGDFTVTHNTLVSCLEMDTWLQRGPNYRCMVISYEQELVHQFSREVWDYLGRITGIEMGDQRVDYDTMPDVVIASRASLLAWPKPKQQQIEQLAEYGITDTGSCCSRHVKQFLKYLKAKKAEPEEVRDEIARLNMEPEAHDGQWSRVHRFDWHYNWLLVFDEAHKHAYHLRTVGPLVDWFSQNPETRWTGMTATPKRGDGVSIGHKMFPGVALDMPLCKPGEPCGVADGWAVPYVQRYIEVEGVDFRSVSRIGKDFDEADLQLVLGKEETLAKLVEPLLDMVEDRQTLIFSPGVQMAKDVAEYINSRSRCVCTCGEVKWHPTLLIGDGAACPSCGRFAETGDIDKTPDQAKELDGDVPSHDRTPIYEDHQSGTFQFLSICGLCREGYNDPNVSCIAVFRPVSKAASSLAEQMKGRGCRALRGLLNKWPLEDQREQRLEAIANSDKPNCLIIDLVGITGLADCASTIQIYAEGLPDEVVQRAEEILLEQGTDGVADVEGAIDQAKQEAAEARAKAKAEREAAEQHSREMAERRAKAGAEAKYTVHESGVGSQVDPKEASEKQYRFAAFLGMNIENTALSKRQMGRIISQIQDGMPLDEVARLSGIDDRNWQAVGPTSKQKWALRGLHADWVKTRADASMLITASKKPEAFVAEMRAAINNCSNSEALTRVARDIGRIKKVVRLDADGYAQLIELGKEKRSQLTPTEF